MTMTTTTTTPITALVKSGESVFTAITGKNTDNQQKIVDGAANLLDGALPTVESKVSFDLAGIVAGVTGILGGVALVIASLKAKKTADNPASSGSSSPSGTQVGS